MPAKVILEACRCAATGTRGHGQPSAVTAAGDIAYVYAAREDADGCLPPAARYARNVIRLLLPASETYTKPALISDLASCCFSSLIRCSGIRSISARLDRYLLMNGGLACRVDRIFEG